MKKKILLLMALFVLPILVNAKEIKQEWTKEHEKYPQQMFNNVIETQDNTYVAVGYGVSQQDGGGSQTLLPLIIKYDKDGNVIWEKIASDSSANSQFNSAIELTDGSIIAVGSTVAKYSKDGTKLWNKTIFGLSQVYSIVKNSNGNYTIMGSKSEAYTSNSYIVEIDEEGNELNNTVLVSGTSLSSFAATTDKNGNYYYVYSWTGRDGLFHFYVNKRSFNEQLFQKEVGNNKGQVSKMTSIKVAEDGSIYIIGSETLTAENGYNYPTGYIAKFDSEGSQLWYKTQEEEAEDQIFSGYNDFIVLDDGTIMVVGQKNNKNLIVTYNADGEKVNEEITEDDYYYTSIINTKNDDIVMVGNNSAKTKSIITKYSSIKKVEEKEDSVKKEDNVINKITKNPKTMTFVGWFVSLFIISGITMIILKNKKIKKYNN